MIKQSRKSWNGKLARGGICKEKQREVASNICKSKNILELYVKFLGTIFIFIGRLARKYFLIWNVQLPLIIVTILILH